ncbi:hypothetical protein [Geotalea uraniireducens]|uniref:Uncharacterized protein n=1 Tax=Geotalea uraniireducens (strain Rf4) TaxID=351605 RepID=A5G798_GEOUR|nr:hypothetical protein [Geotalea uraniireducens]ABQ27666.1 hypothetical protein Gura_3511 [Geotalea uraniireducens Rf4]
MPNKETSIQRSKKSTITLAEIGVKEGLGLIVPGGSAMYEIGKVLFEHGRRYIQDRNESRIDEFNKLLLEGVPESEQDKLINNEFSIEDYCSLLSSAIADDEQVKLQYYSTLLKSVILNKINPVYKIHILKSLKELSSEDIDYAKEIYIASKHVFKGPNSISAQVKSLVSPGDPLKIVSLQKLTRLGFLVNSTKDECLMPSKIMEEVVESIFSEEFLTPEAIGKQAWLKLEVGIFCCDLTKNGDFIRRMSNIYQALDVRAGGAAVPRIGAFLFLCDLLIVYFSKEDDAATWAEFGSKIRKNHIIKVYIAEDENDHFVDYLRENKSILDVSIIRNRAEDYDEFKKKLEIILFGEEQH